MEQFDKQIKELENKIDSEEKKQALLNDRTREYEAELKEATSQVNELSKELDNTADKATKLQEAIRNTRAGSYERFDLKKQYDEVWESGHKLLGELEKAEAKQNNLKDKVAKTKLQYENSAKAIDKMRGKLELVNMKRHLFQMKEFEKGVNKVKDGIQNTIGKIGKMAMAVLGVRSAFMLVRQASSTWAQYNEQYAKDLEYIRFALASGLAPVLEKISEKMAGKVEFFNVDVDENGELADMFHITNIPCLVLIKNGVEVSRSVGFQPEPNLTSWIESNL